MHGRCRRLALALLIGDRWILTPLACKSWGCPRCREHLARRWTSTLAQLRPNLFGTLTLSPARLRSEGILRNYRAQQRYVAEHWRAFIKQLRREYGRVRYFRVYEFHRGNWSERDQVHNNRIHIHALLEVPAAHGGGFSASVRRHAARPLRRYDRRRDPLSWIAHRNGFGISRFYDLIDDSRTAAAYVTKYTTKLKLSAYQHRIRLVSTSRDIKHRLRLRFGPGLQDWCIVTGGTPFIGQILDHIAQDLGATEQDSAVDRIELPGNPHSLDRIGIHRDQDNHPRARFYSRDFRPSPHLVREDRSNHRRRMDRVAPSSN